MDGTPVGTAGGLRDGDDAELVSMWVHPGQRGRGIGDDLVRAVVEWTGRQGCGVVRLWVSEGNEPAERLYARHGFVRTGEVQPIVPDDPLRREFAMARRRLAAERAGGGWRWILRPALARQPPRT